MELKLVLDNEFEALFLYLCGKLYEGRPELYDRLYSNITEALKREPATFRRPPKAKVPEVVSHLWGVNIGECVLVRNKLLEKGLMSELIPLDEEPNPQPKSL